ncbi:AraC family transcriptional regulator [Thaumasiovibrio subtropicus]|uniref:AraC family transcriptional regulator n=1 Tax=Thaumasiovibrio subtropicus TaxID=1891207 RepID=UPI000B363CCA|nr:helix-turn-helix transcriptional regulator [Thaumasiovibrio subtropicus]
MITTIPASTNNEQPLADTFLTFDAFKSNTETHPHHHRWGQLQVIKGGLLELATPKRRFLTPPNLGIWVPAHTTHFSFNRQPIEYCAINIIASLCEGLPKQTCQIPISPIVTAIVDDFRRRQIRVPETEQDKRMLAVMLDQIRAAKPSNPFLPSSQHKLLAPILNKLERFPDHNRTLQTWAARLHTTERTLARHCQNELGMSFTEWRTRLRYVTAAKLLREGMAVKEVALTLGYHQTSPFITMFKKYANTTPERYRQALLAEREAERGTDI